MRSSGAFLECFRGFNYRATCALSITWCTLDGTCKLSAGFTGVFIIRRTFRNRRVVGWFYNQCILQSEGKLSLIVGMHFCGILLRQSQRCTKVDDIGTN